MTSFALPVSLAALARDLRQALTSRKALVESLAMEAEGAVKDLNAQVSPPPLNTAGPDAKAASETNPSEKLVEPYLDKRALNSGPQTYQVDLANSAFAAVFALADKPKMATPESVSPDRKSIDAPTPALALNLEVLTPFKPLPQDDLEQMESDLRAMGALSSDVNFSRAMAAGFSLKEEAQLRVIKGIGPKTLAMLHAANIKTFDDLADSSERDLQEVLRGSGPYRRLARPASWIKQANLAALNQWEALRSLQGPGAKSRGATRR
jgi:predicted flap endonuclease-1-like 5' DNA nuclease